MSSSFALFDCVIVVTLRNDNGTSKPFVSYRFPPADKDKADEITQKASLFCYPEEDEWNNPEMAARKLRESKSESFSFVLTEGDGSKRFGYCRRFIVKNPQGALVPECYCILSLVPSMSLFMHLLDVIEVRRKLSSTAVFAFLKNVLAHPLPNPGETLVVRTFEGDKHELHRPEADYSFDFVSFGPLLRQLGATNLMNLFARLLCESRLIVVSSTVSSLSAAVNSLAGLLCPFSWQHIYVPILPKQLCDYCCAPMPFLLGVVSSNLPMLQRMRQELDEVIIFDVDSNQQVSLSDAEPEPWSYRSVLPLAADTLRRRLNSILKRSVNVDDRAVDVAIAQTFLEFFFFTFGPYQDFFFPDGTFDREGFYRQRPKDVQKFVDHLNQTQIYEMFIKEREAMCRAGLLDRCILSKKKFAELVQKANDTIGPERRDLLAVPTGPACFKCDADLEAATMVESKGRLYCPACKDKKNTKKKFKTGLRNFVSAVKSIQAEFAASTSSSPQTSAAPTPVEISAPYAVSSTASHAALAPAGSAPRPTPVDAPSARMSLQLSADSAAALQQIQQPSRASLPPNPPAYYGTVPGGRRPSVPGAFGGGPSSSVQQRPPLPPQPQPQPMPFRVSQSDLDATRLAADASVPRTPSPANVSRFVPPAGVPRAPSPASAAAVGSVAEAVARHAGIAAPPARGTVAPPRPARTLPSSASVPPAGPSAASVPTSGAEAPARGTTSGALPARGRPVWPPQTAAAAPGRVPARAGPALPPRTVGTSNTGARPPDYSALAGGARPAGSARTPTYASHAPPPPASSVIDAAPVPAPGPAPPNANVMPPPYSPRGTEPPAYTPAVQPPPYTPPGYATPFDDPPGDDLSVAAPATVADPLSGPTSGNEVSETGAASSAAKARHTPPARPLPVRPPARPLPVPPSRTASHP